MPELYHVGITCSNMDDSIRFYTEVAGMTLHSRLETVSGEWMKDLKGISRQPTIRVAHLEMGPFMLQLVEYKTHQGKRLELQHHNIGNVHMSIFVGDVEAKRAEVEAWGRVERLSPVVTIATSGRRSFYTADPDGIMVEFMSKEPVDPPEGGDGRP